MSKRKRVLIVTLLASLLIIAAGVWWFNLRKSSDSRTSNPQQKVAIRACDAFTAEEAKQLFGDSVSQNSLDSKNEYKISTKIDEAPKTETTSSSCVYTKGKWELNTSTDQPAPPDDKPVPEGKQKPVDLKPFLDNMKKTSSAASALPEFLAVITVHSTTQENASADFNRFKSKSAQTVDGLGKPAFWNPEALGMSGKKQGSLSVLAGDNILIVSGDNLNIETAKKIANIILGKL